MVPTVQYFRLPRDGEERLRLTDLERRAEVRLLEMMEKYPDHFRATSEAGVWCFSERGFGMPLGPV
jgi:hypothetical protein